MTRLLARAITWPLDLAAHLVTNSATWRRIDAAAVEAMNVWYGDEERPWE